MAPLPIHLVALLLALSVAEPLTTPHGGSDNEVLKHSELEVLKSQVS